MKKYFLIVIPALLAMVFTVLGVVSIVNYRLYRSLELESRNLREQVLAGDRIADPYQAVALYQTLSPASPVVQLRIVQRQWLMALEILQQIQRAGRNPILEKDSALLYNKLQGHLEKMGDECNVLLTESGSLPEEIAWQIYNLRGSVRLLMAFSVLETERNWKKVIGIMKEAISDLKSAIAAVDKTNSSAFRKNVPRWNLELLQGEQFVRKFQYATVTDDQRLELKDNLEAIIPERGGYAPGEPVERKILK